jgi:hypothetical protein
VFISRLTGGASAATEEPKAMSESAARDEMDSSYDENGIEVPASRGALALLRKEESVEKHMTVAVDVAKNVFEIAVSQDPRSG